MSLSLGAVIQALSFIFVPLLSLTILKEKIKKNVVIGICIIILGVVIYSL